MTGYTRGLSFMQRKGPSYVGEVSGCATKAAGGSPLRDSLLRLLGRRLTQLAFGDRHIGGLVLTLGGNR